MGTPPLTFWSDRPELQAEFPEKPEKTFTLTIPESSSPGIALIRIARAEALLSGRDFVTPDDVKRVTLPALRHRITLTPDMEIEGRRTDEVLSGILENVEAPRVEA